MKWIEIRGWIEKTVAVGQIWVNFRAPWSSYYDVIAATIHTEDMDPERNIDVFIRRTLSLDTDTILTHLIEDVLIGAGETLYLHENSHGRMRVPPHYYLTISAEAVAVGERLEYFLLIEQPSYVLPTTLGEAEGAGEFTLTETIYWPRGLVK